MCGGAAWLTMNEEMILNAIPYLMSETEAILTAMKNILLNGDGEMVGLSLLDFLDFMVDPHQRFPLVRLMNDREWQRCVVRRVMDLPLRIEQHVETSEEDEESDYRGDGSLV
ncbi:MAG: hypothetical protein DRQ98_13400 [Gammaproteobacteria bacterium]|nr:MAG: hypothetical protein DRQ98_13400 [Gammaproteobacteria bacterium]